MVHLSYYCMNNYVKYLYMKFILKNIQKCKLVILVHE